MHNFFILLLAFFSFTASAQIALEHTYPFGVERIRLHDGTDRYISQPYALNGIWQVDVYNGQHQLLQTIVPEVPAGATAVTLSLPADHFFDADPGIEFMLNSLPGGRSFHDDNGSRLTGLFAGTPTLVSLSSGIRKLIIGDSIYGVPAMNKEFVFPKGETTVRFATLEDSGDHYYSLLPDSNLTIWNPDYTVFRQFKTELNLSSGTYTPLLLGQYKLNGDPAIEWRASATPTSGATTWFFSDDDQISQHSWSYSTNSQETTLFPSEWPELASPLSVYSLVSTGVGAVIQVKNLDAGSLSFQPDLSERYTWGNTFTGGLKYWQIFPPNNITPGTIVRVLNYDYTSWAEFPVESTDFRYYGPSDQIFDNDPATKEIVVRTLPPFKVSVRNETGQNILVVDSLAVPLISRLTNLPNKFLCSVSENGVTVKTAVYGLPSSGPVSAAPVTDRRPELAISVYPNPAVSAAQLDLTQLEISTVNLSVHSRTGAVLFTHPNVVTGSVVPVPGIDTLPSGLYWIRVAATDGRYGWCKFIKQ